MDRENLYESIYTNDTVYRPPQEEGSALLEVTLGCSWKKCAFCDFSRDPFQVTPLDILEEKLRVLAELEPENPRVFFLSENAFSLDAAQLSQRMSLTRRHMPKVTQFAMYARADDILRKKTAELERLRDEGLNHLYIGVESGSDPILTMVNKGVTAGQILEAMHKLDAAGIDYSVTIILGLGGRTYRNLHAIETGRLLSRAHPKCIWALALKLWPGTLLEKEAAGGNFDPMTAREMLFEERLLLQNLLVEDCLYLDTTVLNALTIQGVLQKGKDAILNTIETLLLRTE